MMDPGDGAGGDGIGKVEDEGAALICDKSEELMSAVVLVRVCRVLGAGWARYREYGSACFD